MFTPEFRRRHDFPHQSAPCLGTVGFLNRLDKSSDIVHLHAALQVCIGQRFHDCPGDRISFGLALVHQTVDNLDARLDLFWAEDWPALWVMVRAEFEVAPVHSTTRTTTTEQKRSRIRKVATLARSGEKGRALPAARNAPPIPVTEQIVQEIRSLYPTDPDPPAPAQGLVSNLFLSEVAELISSTLRKMPRHSELGPLGMRAEHWYDFGALAGNSNLFVQVVAHIATALVTLHVTVPQGWTDHATRQTHGWGQTASDDVLSPQTCSQITHGSQQGISCQMCWNSAVWSGTTRWRKHDDQDHSNILRRMIPPESVLRLTSRLLSRMTRIEPCCVNTTPKMP